MIHLIYRACILFLCLSALPGMACISLAICVIDGLPVFFTQKRTGKDGKPFRIYKFRTMTADAEARKASLIARNEAHGPAFKIRNDPRFTGFGRFLSHTGMDELPQLWNVLRGEMALIGPRPLPVAEAGKLDPWMRARHKILPGIISPAILSGTYHRNFYSWMKSDVSYAATKTPRGDAVLIFRFVPFIFRLFARGILGR